MGTEINDLRLNAAIDEIVTGRSTIKNASERWGISTARLYKSLREAGYPAKRHNFHKYRAKRDEYALWIYNVTSKLMTNLEPPRIRFEDHFADADDMGKFEENSLRVCLQRPDVRSVTIWVFNKSGTPWRVLYDDGKDVFGTEPGYPSWAIKIVGDSRHREKMFLKHDV